MCLHDASWGFLEPPEAFEHFLMLHYASYCFLLLVDSSWLLFYCFLYKTVTTSTNKKGWKTYELEGTLFFASAKNFHELFDIQKDPKDVVVDFKGSRVADHSAIMAIDNLANKYKAAGKKLHLVHLSPDCLDILDTAKSMVEVNLLEDPKYHIADDKIS